MSKFTSLTISLGLIFLGFVLTAAVLNILSLQIGFGLMGGIAVGLAFGVVETIAVHRSLDPIPTYYRLDSDIFPFVSIGITSAMTVI